MSAMPMMSSKRKSSSQLRAVKVVSPWGFRFDFTKLVEKIQGIDRRVWDMAAESCHFIDVFACLAAPFNARSMLFKPRTAPFGEFILKSVSRLNILSLALRR